MKKDVLIKNNFLGLLLLCFTALPLAQAKKDNSDPNGYFRNRSWTLSFQGKTVEVVSTYRGEPVQKPNALSASLRCDTKSSLNITKDLKYCGLDSVKVIGNQLELMLTDYDIKDPRGYCRLKRTLKIALPACP